MLNLWTILLLGIASMATVYYLNRHFERWSEERGKRTLAEAIHEALERQDTLERQVFEEYVRPVDRSLEA